ncbi:MAG: translocation/assembly module TamB domain-containing protein, partial [Nitrospirales bacterium]|nr:translocation/assembly module TamB domain-containing protein [Nitrospirales bacterium]
MDQANILSYLVLGRPLQSATGEEGKLLYKAASSLSFSGGEFLAQRIGGALGIKDIHIEQGEEFREAALVVGTYLSPRIYVSYGIGLFEPVNRLRIRYELSKKLLLQVESGLESGADLFYRIER